jgi:hypothetical protein
MRYRDMEELAGRHCGSPGTARARPLLAQRFKPTGPLPAALSLTRTALTVRVSDISVSDRQPVGKCLPLGCIQQGPDRQISASEL